MESSVPKRFDPTSLFNGAFSYLSALAEVHSMEDTVPERLGSTSLFFSRNKRGGFACCGVAIFPKNKKFVVTGGKKLHPRMHTPSAF